MMPVGEFP